MMLPVNDTVILYSLAYQYADKHIRQAVIVFFIRCDVIMCCFVEEIDEVGDDIAN